MSPLLSICIPTYNRASLLELTLENILALYRTAGSLCDKIDASILSIDDGKKGDEINLAKLF